ncbi:helix-turn-helix domain-containing protein [Streptomyces sp. ISL-43]|uniref:telomere-associated protein Tap n=1 Tax=Streptomyces sp. ISL-43 TaxID=2819183 RepID=UPI001BE798FF|nr:helix-turn-helix domain-containing protein [Streptomyces sp. ISL-43]MBT2446201.1 helix-turn-helix domain-containing protein [Streptomyces sp. ISL-43]
MPTEEELFDAVDALLAGEPAMPPPAERARLREAAGITQARLAQALQTTTQSVKNWEVGRSEPRPPRRQAYQRLLDGWAAQYATPVKNERPVPEAFAGPAASEAPEAPTGLTHAATAPVQPPAAVPPSPPEVPSSTKPPSSRRAGAKKAVAKPELARAAADPRFENGPLAVLDVENGQVVAYCVGGLVLEVPAKTVPALVDWTLTEAKLGQARLHRSGFDADPMLVLTPAALERYGLPTALTPEERSAGRLKDGHKVIRQVERAGLELTKRGFGAWTRIFYRPEDGKRRCVQLCIPAWGALPTSEWDDKKDPQLPTMSAADLARFLGTYAERVITPRGFTATTGLALMTALRPPTRAEKDETTGAFKPAYNADALTAVYDVVECEVPDEHPILKGKWPRHHQRTPDQMLMEEPFSWCRELTDDECLKPYLVGIDVNMAFAAAANSLVVGLNGPTHLTNPAFDKALPGSWLVDLSHVDLSRARVGGRTVDGDRLPSPFTPSGERPTGPAWYATPSVAYAVQLGFDVAPIEAYVRTETGRYLDPWYDRLRDAYLATMADLGVVPGMDDEAFLEAMARVKDGDPALKLLLKAIKATAKGGIGKLRQRNSRGEVPFYEPWPALERETWRPDIRAAVLSTVRVIMHRKMMKTAAAADVYPVAIGTDCIVYPSDGPSPLDFLPYTPDGKPVTGTFRLGVSPGMVKWEGTQTVLWAEQKIEELGGLFNIARNIKDGRPADDGE